MNKIIAAALLLTTTPAFAGTYQNAAVGMLVAQQYCHIDVDAHQLGYAGILAAAEMDISMEEAPLRLAALSIIMADQLKTGGQMDGFCDLARSALE